MRLTLRQLRQVIHESAAGNIKAHGKQVILSGDLDALQVLVDMLQEAGDPRGEQMLSKKPTERASALLSFLFSHPRAYDNSQGGLSFPMGATPVTTSNISGDVMIWIGYPKGQNFHCTFLDPKKDFPLAIVQTEPDESFPRPPNFEPGLSLSSPRMFVGWDGSWAWENVKDATMGNVKHAVAMANPPLPAKSWQPKLAKALPNLKDEYDTLMPIAKRIVFLVDELPKLFPNTET